MLESHKKNFVELVLTALESKNNNVLSQGEIDNTIRQSANFYTIINDVKIEEEEIVKVIKYFETLFSQEMGEGCLFKTDKYIPWLDENKADINWFYWKRYEKHLNKNGFSPNVTSTIDLVTSKILDNCQNPKDKDKWSRKGLVVGHVQSGKTANYTGVITKAADAGYKVIIVLAGILSALRSQTQERIDEGFIGRDSSRILDVVKGMKVVGVGLERSIETARFPVSLTTSDDFDTAAANRIQTSIDGFKEPVVLVLKKNKSILNNVINWFKSNNLHLKDVPMLLIDDEADHASINTAKEESDPTTINSKIRELIKLFDKNTYIGYTATPFANIFIDPDSSDDMRDDDLFPRDFILNLDAPSNYIGPNKIFGKDSTLKIVREVYDCEDLIPMKHKKDFIPGSLPESLKEAISCFIITKAIRILRGQIGKNNSMLVNISRFTDVQSHLKVLIYSHVSKLSDDIINHYAKPELSALKNKSLQELKSVFDSEYSAVEFSWADVQSKLKKSIAPLKVIEVNASIASEPLDYDKEKYPNGRTLIAVGGMSLSRGLTLEGLTVSYFMRNSQMYDTLQQQGRWFGYRPNFEDICRIYMSPEAISWYRHISDATDELRYEFSRMEKARMSPSQFGLSVRAHPDSLMVTARNKMRNGNKCIRRISLSGKLIQTDRLLSTHSDIKTNHMLLNKFVVDINAYQSDKNMFKNVPKQSVINFISNFKNHRASIKSEPKGIVEYINKKYQEIDVVLISPTTGKSSLKEKSFMNEIVMKAAKRKVIFEPSQNLISSKNSTFVSPDWESSGLGDEIITKLKRKHNSVSGINYRECRDKPLLMLSILDCKNRDEEKANSLNHIIGVDGIVFWAISFPVIKNPLDEDNQVEYIVNTQYWKELYAEYEYDGDED